jgi:hypothetical protein
MEINKAEYSNDLNTCIGSFIGLTPDKKQALITEALAKGILRQDPNTNRVDFAPIERQETQS